MFGRRKNQNTGTDHLDRVRLNITRTLKVSDEEISSVADSPDLYHRIRMQIAAERNSQITEAGAKQNGPFFLGSLMGLGSRRWVMAAAALLLFAIVATMWLRSTMPIKEQLVKTSHPDNGQSGIKTISDQDKDEPKLVSLIENERSLKSIDPSKKGGRIVKKVYKNAESEVATDYLPLTYQADTVAMEGTQIVRVSLPRSALVSLGMPMNVERAGEVVKADIVIGDDGLARAIRFIQ